MERKNENISFDESVSVNTIYKWIRKCIFENLTLECLPEGGRRKTKNRKARVQKRVVKGVSIEKRPDEISERQEFGHWEMDTVVGKQTNRKNLLVLTERKTREEIIEVLKFHTCDEVRKALNRIEKRFGATFYSIFKSITVDNGSEFADFDEIVNTHDAKKAEAWLNSYPRKILNGRTAALIYFNKNPLPYNIKNSIIFSL